MSRKAFMPANGVLWNLGSACDLHQLNKQLRGIHLPVLGRVIFPFVSLLPDAYPQGLHSIVKAPMRKSDRCRCCPLRSLVAKVVNLHGHPMRKSSR